MKYPFRFDFDKTLEAVAFLLRRERSRRMNYMRLIKVLYIADRESLKETGRPITGSHVVAMERGPVLEELLWLICGQHSQTPKWSEFMLRESYSLEMTKDPGVGHLSKYITQKLEEVAQRHDQHDEWDMVRITHQLPEWFRNDPGNSSKPIPFESLLEAIGLLADADQILDDARLVQSTVDFVQPA